MAARSIWKGDIKIGSARVPVKLYSAVQDHTIHFHMLEKRNHHRIKQHMVDPETGAEISNDEIRKGYEVERGTFVLLEEKELEKFEPEASRDVEVVQFVAPDHLDAQWYDRPYYAGPDGNSKDYFALAEALQAKDRVGIARWVMRNKQYLGALRVEAGYLVIVTLRYAEEVLSTAELSGPSGKALAAGELKMARQLVEVLRDDFRPEDFQDDYRDRVMEFIEAKARGRRPRLHAVQTRKPSTSLMDQLAKSLKAVPDASKEVSRRRKVA
jgi:DNA end-binding protein Ku